MATLQEFPIVKSVRKIAREFGRESAVLESLLDLRLFCHVNGLDFYAILDQSYQAYLESVNATAETELARAYKTSEASCL